jgi:predicted nuclease with RNAse H fold
MRSLGVDLATAVTNTAACVLDWDGGSPRLVSLLPSNVDDARICELAADADVTGIDAPFGWPIPFSDALTGYSSGAPWPRTRPDGLWFRRTDERALAVAGGRPPLSVSSDRIARPAERAARLLTLLGSADRAAARDGSDDVIEVYPAGALRCWSVPADGYKRPTGIAARERIVAAVVAALGVEFDPDQHLALTGTDHATDALIASLVARAFAKGCVVRPEGPDQPIALIEGWLYLPVGSMSDLV